MLRFFLLGEVGSSMDLNIKNQSIIRTLDGNPKTNGCGSTKTTIIRSVTYTIAASIKCAMNELRRGKTSLAYDESEKLPTD